nr:zinc-binding dehydrogenase [Pseudomonadota bacterium]
GAANSGVGRSVIALAREKGLRTVNVVRRPELVEQLRAAGADLVFVDGADVATRIRAAIGEQTVKLGLDGLSGPGTGTIADILSPGATLVTYGAMTYAPATVAPADLIYKGLTIRGFFLGHPEHANKFPALIAQAGSLIAAGRLVVPVAAVYPLTAVKQALAHAQRGGKVLLAPTAS